MKTITRYAFIAATLLSFSLQAQELYVQTFTVKVYIPEPSLSGKHIPCPNARVKVDEKEYYTNDQGMITFSSKDYYKVKVSAAGYNAHEFNLISKNPKETIVIYLSKMAEATKPLHIGVVDRSYNPIVNADIKVQGGAHGKTNNSGYFRSFHYRESGEYVNITVTAKGYKTYDKPMMVGVAQGTAVSRPDDMITIMMEKETTVKNALVTIQVFDHETGSEVNGASVQLKYNGKTYSGVSAANGQARFTSIPIDENAAGVVTVQHSKYNDKMSDIPADFMQTSYNEKYYSVFLKKKVVAVTSNTMKRYGPFTASWKNWVSTGLRIKKGEYFKTETIGEISYWNTETKQQTVISPNGHGYWGWWRLKVKINDWMSNIGEKSQEMAGSEGVIEIGIPRVATYVPEDVQNPPSGQWQVYIYAKNVIVEGTPEQDQQAKQDMRDNISFLESVYYGRKIEYRDPQEIASQVSFIASKYNLKNVKRHNLQKGLEAIRKQREHISNGTEKPSNEEMQLSLTILISMINELQAMMAE